MALRINKLPSAELEGRVFGRLTIINVFKGPLRRECVTRCACGTQSIKRLSFVTSGKTQSCGCLLREALPFAHRTHGCSREAGGNRLAKRAYGSWCAMRSRCMNPKHEFYADYGGRGITICARWIGNFSLFLDDMGLPPTAHHSIERKNVNSNYQPDNCVWATTKQQAINKRPYRKHLP